jgi:hypothetical protein
MTSHQIIYLGSEAHGGSKTRQSIKSKILNVFTPEGEEGDILVVRRAWHGCAKLLLAHHTIL